MGVHNILKTEEFKGLVLENTDSLKVLDCYATWCGPCKVIAPVIVKFSEEYSDVTFYKVDVDEVSDVAAELGVRAMPTFFFFKNGEKVGEVVGANQQAIKAAIEKYRV